MLFELLNIIEPDADDTKRKCAQLLKGNSLDFEALVMVDGKPLWVEVVPQVIKDAGGNNIAILSIVSDISQRKETERILRFSDSAFKSIKEGTLITDNDFKVIQLNEAGERILGVKAKDAIGKNQYDFLDILVPSMDELKSELELYRKNGKFHYEHLIKVPAGQIWVDVTLQKIKNNNGEDIANLAIFNDITHRKEIEKALKESEERHRYITDSTYEIIQSGGKDGKFLFVNNAWHKILGYSEEDIKNLNFIDILHPDSVEHCQNLFKKVLSGQRVNNIATKFIAKNGNIVIVEGNAMPRLIGNEVFATLGFFSDITKRKQMEESLRFSDAALKSIQEGMIISDKNFNVISINKAGEKIFGIKACDVIGKNLLHQVTSIEPSAEEIDKRAQKFLVTGSDLHWEHKIKAPSGEIWIDVLIQKIKDHKGNYIANLAIINDIKQRKKTEEAIKEEATIRKKLFEHSPVGIVIVDPETARILDFNNTACRQLGYSRKEFAALTIMDIEVIQDKEKILANMAQIREKRKIEFETLHKTRTGEIRNVSIISHVIQISGREVFQAIWKDITERKRWNKG
jgi:PAS domain S-box-containing protein